MLRLPLSLALACLAVLALLTNPVAAAAAQMACTPAAMAGMDDAAAMAPMADADHAQVRKAANPCCDQAAQHQPGKACAQACAAACAVIIALPYSPPGQGLVYVRAPAPAFRLVWPQAHDPAGLKRPPKSMA